MPWPQNSRTTEKPFFSACFWITSPISPRRQPGLTSWMALYMHSWVTWDRRSAQTGTLPTWNMRLVSPW